MGGVDVDRRESGPRVWPALPLDEWKDSYDTLHMWTQVVGKISLASAPLVNHWWQSTLRVTARGLSTPTLFHGDRNFQIALDFVGDRLRVACSDGSERSFPLAPMAVADFYRQTMDALDDLGLGVKIWTRPVEVADPIPFEQDRQHASYNPEYVHRLFRILVEVDRVFKEFRSRFVGKVSPSQFFWGSFDLAVTRFSGRKAPAYTGGAFNVGRWVMEEAYSHELSSLGWWPGGGSTPYPAFYSYASPEPMGFRDAPVLPGSAFYNEELGEFILPYDEVRRAEHPGRALLEFAQSSYEAAADLGKWDRPALERQDMGRRKAA